MIRFKSQKQIVVIVNEAVRAAAGNGNPNETIRDKYTSNSNCYIATAFKQQVKLPPNHHVSVNPYRLRVVNQKTGENVASYKIVGDNGEPSVVIHAVEHNKDLAVVLRLKNDNDE